MKMTTTDRALMEQVAAGDHRAFAALVQRYSPRLLAVAQRLLGSREDAEDAVQRAFLNCFTSARSYRPDWAVSTWLYRIATNICVDELRRRKSRAALHLDAPLFRRTPPAPQAIRLDLQRALERVPREARVLLALRYVDGLTYDELARVRGISVNTVKSQLARGKVILRSGLLGRGRRTPARSGPPNSAPAGSRRADAHEKARMGEEAAR
jgi:RNA polymerase sigma-70 factor (ECF subfamily)